MTTPRIAIVTGAGRGIGRALVHRLAAEDWCVVAVDVGDPSDLSERLGYPLATADDLLDTVRAVPTGNIVAFPADVRDLDALDSAVATAVERYGGLDAAVAVAGVIAGGKPLWRTPPEVLRTLLEVNVVGVANLAHAAVPALLAQPLPRSGRFVAVASAAAHRGLLHLAAYGASKAGCVALVRGLAADLADTGVTANVVSPGSTDTAMLARTAELYGARGPTAFARQALLRRLLDPQEVAATLAWLCSADSSAVTGAVLSADAGLTT